MYAHIFQQMDGISDFPQNHVNMLLQGRMYSGFCSGFEVTEEKLQNTSKSVFIFIFVAFILMHNRN